MHNFYIKIRDLRILKEIKNINDFYQRIMIINENFHYQGTIVIDIFDDLAELKNMLKINIPKWVIGTSFKNIILILDHDKWKNSNKESIENLILHEMVHVLINKQALHSLPLWLNEGLAVYLSGQYAASQHKIEEKSFNFYDLDYTSNHLYSESRYIIFKLAEKYGIDKVVSEALTTKDFKESLIFNNKNLLNLL